MDDNCALMYLNEAMHLRKRFMIDEVYTFTANILLALNPYHSLNIYLSTSRSTRASPSEPFFPTFSPLVCVVSCVQVP